jgi:hypothetical protein
MQQATELWQQRIQSKREKQASGIGEGTWGELNKVHILLALTSRLRSRVYHQNTLRKLQLWSLMP